MNLKRWEEMTIQSKKRSNPIDSFLEPRLRIERIQFILWYMKINSYEGQDKNSVIKGKDIRWYIKELRAS